MDAFPLHRKYDAIVVDPPWPYSRSKCKKYRGVLNYNTMTMKEMEEMPMNEIGKENSALFLWVTGPMVPFACPLMAKWGYRFRTVFLVWRKVYNSGKPRCGPGWYTRPCYEYLYIGVKGTVMPLRKCYNLSQSLETTLEAHSVKPQESFDRIHEWMHAVDRVELFARKPRPGWDTWGEELSPQYRFGQVGSLVAL